VQLMADTAERTARRLLLLQAGPTPVASGGADTVAGAPAKPTQRPTPVQAGRQEVDATVAIVFLIGPA